MKQFISFLCAFALSVVVAAQNEKATNKTTAVKPAVPVLKTLDDSASYAVGVSVANFYKQQGIQKLNTTLVSKAINDVLGGKGTLLNDKEVNNVLNAYMNKMQEEKVKPVLEAGKQFLAVNKKRPEIKATASGLQYEVLIEGTGPKPKATDKVTVHYKGTFLNGIEFDSSFKNGQPVTFALNGVIAGWTEGLQLMSVGAKYKFYVPHNLGYGMYDYNSIPGGSTLIFEVELIAIPQNPAQ